MSDALAVSQGAQLARATLEFSAEQRKLIRDSFANGATETEFGVLMEVARARRLNPLLQQIHFVKRWNAARGCEVWSTQVGIDGLRAVAERTGKYDGQDEPEFEYDAKGALKACKVRVYRKDIGRPFVGVAFFGEYAQTKKDGSLTNMWATKPRIMLSKCAEALAFRKGFPEDMAGLYVPEEMGTEEKEINPPPTNGGGAPAPALPSSTTSRTEQVKAKLKAGAVVDVKTGETEAEAKARAAMEQAQAAQATPMPKLLEESVQAMLRLSLLQKELGFSGAKMASTIKGATGKADRSQLTLADVDRVKAAVEVMIAGAAPPPPTDAEMRQRFGPDAMGRGHTEEENIPF